MSVSSGGKYRISPIASLPIRKRALEEEFDVVDNLNELPADFPEFIELTSAVFIALCNAEDEVFPSFHRLAPY
jgi:hypothetical protein